MPPIELTLTAANVRISPSNAIGSLNGYAGEALAGFQLIYPDPGDDNKLKLASDLSAITANAVGFTVMNAATNDQVDYLGNGQIIKSSTAVFAVGVWYFVAPTGGKIAESVDSGGFSTRIGYGLTVNELMIDIRATGLQLA